MPSHTVPEPRSTVSPWPSAGVPSRINLLEVAQCQVAFFERDLRSPPRMSADNIVEWKAWSARLQVTSVSIAFSSSSLVP
jgi:hypothetical protein